MITPDACSLYSLGQKRCALMWHRHIHQDRSHGNVWPWQHNIDAKKIRKIQFLFFLQRCACLLYYEWQVRNRKKHTELQWRVSLCMWNVYSVKMCQKKRWDVTWWRRQSLSTGWQQQRDLMLSLTEETWEVLTSSSSFTLILLLGFTNGVTFASCLDLLSVRWGRGTSHWGVSPVGFLLRVLACCRNSCNCGLFDSFDTRWGIRAEWITWLDFTGLLLWVLLQVRWTAASRFLTCDRESL